MKKRPETKLDPSLLWAMFCLGWGLGMAYMVLCYELAV